MGLIVNSPEAEAQSRLTAIRLVSMTLRQMESWRGVLDDHDCLMAMMAVAVINTESLTRKKLAEQSVADLNNAVPLDMLRRCSISSVALATGLNRETARRKIAYLIERKFLAKCPNGHVYLHPELPIREQIVETVQSQLDVFTKTANALLRDRTLKFVHHEEGES